MKEIKSVRYGNIHVTYKIVKPASEKQKEKLVFLKAVYPGKIDNYSNRFSD